MDKRIYLVRHAQGEHNISNDFTIPDAPLTPFGKSQCTHLSTTFPSHLMAKIKVILSSPLRRAIQTAIHSFSPALEREEVKLVLTPLAQEISGKACDVGLEREELKREVERLLSLDGDGGKGVGGKINYEGCNRGWCLKKGIYEDSLPAVEARAKEMRKYLWNRKETKIVLVTHGAFLHYLTDDWDGFVDGHGTAYKNCEYRCFTFTEDSNEKEPHLIEVGKTGARATKPFDAHAKDISGVLPN